jgi:hypothetical protein
MKFITVDRIKVGDLIYCKYTTYSMCTVLMIIYKNENSIVCYLLENNKVVQELIVDYEWTKLNAI